MIKLLLVLPQRLIVLFFFGILMSCQEEASSKHPTLTSENILQPSEEAIKPTAFEPTSEFKSYWYAGEAEISSYQLEQARYGELRQGKAVLVFVTEDFLPKTQVKADQYQEDNIPVLKLNATKTFTTGIYPYSIMQSTFFPIANNQHALKVSCSIQEWCGHVYSQLNNRADFEISSHSYFESEADQNFNLPKTVLENELWTQLRIDPKRLPVGHVEVIPALEFLNLKHLETKPYFAKARLSEGRYELYYQQLDRKLTINFNPHFPYEILSWEETYQDGYGTNNKKLTTTGTKITTIKSAYWRKNANADEILRETLQLKP